MASTGKRVFWNDAEKNLLAEQMARLLLNQPNMSLLQAVREAQMQLPEERRREIVTWSIVAGALQPLLLAAQESMAGLTMAAMPSSVETAPSAEEVQPPANSVEAVAPQLSSPAQAPALQEARPQVQAEKPAPDGSERRSPAAPSPLETAAGFDPLWIEAALTAALTSPAVERALVDLFGRAMSQAFSRLSPGQGTVAGSDSRESDAVSNGRVLLAGFGGPELQALSGVLSEHFEVRVWKPTQSAQLFETLVRMCSVVLVPEHMSEEVDEVVKPLGARLVRFQGSTSRALERVQDALL